MEFIYYEHSQVICLDLKVIYATELCKPLIYTEYVLLSLSQF